MKRPRIISKHALNFLYLADINGLTWIWVELVKGSNYMRIQSNKLNQVVEMDM